MNSTNVTLIVARNDLEAVWLAGLARRAGFSVIALDELEWGDSLPVGDARLESLADTVLLAELPAPVFEDGLRQRGHNVHVLDHHVWTLSDGRVLDRRARLSTLEQAVRLAPVLAGPTADPGCLGRDGVTALVAANDRGFIPALFKTASRLVSGGKAVEGWVRSFRLLELSLLHGATVDTVESALEAFAMHPVDRGGEALEQIRERLGPALSKAEAALAEATESLANGRVPAVDAPARRGTGNAVTILHAPESVRRVLMDAVYAQSLGGSAQSVVTPRDILALYYASDGPERLSSVFFSGNSARQYLVDELFALPDSHCPSIQYGGGGRESCYYGAIFELGEDGDGFVDRLLENLLIDERPVVAWRSHFLQALALPEDWDRQKAVRELGKRWQREDPGEAFGPYLAPHLRPILGLEGDLEEDGTLASFERSALGYSLVVEREESRLEARISSLRLHFFHGCVALLEWTLEGRSDRATEREGTPFWRRLLDGNSHWSLADLLDFNAYARFTHSPFPGPDSVLLKDGDEVARLARGDKPSPTPLAGWFLQLLRDTLPDFEIAIDCVEPLYDERARVVCSALLAGGLPNLDEGWARLSPRLVRLMTVDPSDEGWHADPDFAARELAEGRYSRYDRYHSGTAYGATAHSFVALIGQGGSFPRRVHDEHMPSIYRRLFLLVQFYALNLERYARRLSMEDVEQFPEVLHDQYASFLRLFWQEGATTQVQGEELLALMRKQSSIDASLRRISITL